MSTLIENYLQAKQAIYDHVGLVEDWVVCPIEDNTDMFWILFDNSVRYYEVEENLYSTEGDYCEDDIYTQRFYPKHVYEGADFTLVFCDPHTDGMKWWRLFDNKKRRTLK